MQRQHHPLPPTTACPLQQPPPLALQPKRQCCVEQSPSTRKWSATSAAAAARAAYRGRATTGAVEETMVRRAVAVYAEVGGEAGLREHGGRVGADLRRGAAGGGGGVVPSSERRQSSTTRGVRHSLLGTWKLGLMIGGVYDCSSSRTRVGLPFSNSCWSSRRKESGLSSMLPWYHATWTTQPS